MITVTTVLVVHGGCCFTSLGIFIMGFWAFVKNCMVVEKDNVN